MEFVIYRDIIKSLKIGKNLPGSIYVHASNFIDLPADLAKLALETANNFNISDNSWNIVKFYKRDFKLAYLYYPGFDQDSYPELHLSQIVDLNSSSIRKSDYSKSDNPPILHRKETFVPDSYPLKNLFKDITHEGEVIGLYENTKRIGFKLNWERLIKSKGHFLNESGRLVPLPDKPVKQPHLTNFDGNVERHKTAIDRNHLSQPMQALARHNYLNGDFSIFDYGCGKGDDLRELEAHGINAIGWDPIHRPDTDYSNSDIVNLGFVLNVIEDKSERTETLINAWSHTNKLLVVSVMIASNHKIEKFKPYKDGIITSINTFQKYYSQGEIRYYIESILGIKSIPIGQGVFFIFKKSTDEQTFLISRQYVKRDWNQKTQRLYLSKPKTVKKSTIEKNKELFDDYWNTTLDLGRIPANDEFEFSDQIRNIVGSHNKAHNALLEYYGNNIYIESQLKRKEDLLVYFALGLFEKRKPQTKMPKSLKRDIKVFFKSITSAIEESKELLFSVGKPEVINQACVDTYTELGTGNLEDNHSYTFHISNLGNIPAILRIYIGCATQLYGDIENIHLIKAHIRSGKVSLMRYDDWSKDEPLLLERIKIKLRELDIDFFDYGKTFPSTPLLDKEKYPKYFHASDNIE